MTDAHDPGPAESEGGEGRSDADSPDELEQPDDEIGADEIGSDEIGTDEVGVDEDADVDGDMPTLIPRPPQAI